MALGADQQYDATWSEQDKIRRRQELRARLKVEGVDRRYNPFKQLDGELMEDPAVKRYEDLRKKGRMPGAPFSPKIFWINVGIIVIPTLGLTWILNYTMREKREGLASGDIPYEKREPKS